jgi:hypothetical protein
MDKININNLLQWTETLRGTPDDHKEYEDDYECGWVDACNHVVEMLNTYLAQLPVKGPTNAEIDAMREKYLDGDSASVRDFARAVLARWGK